MNVLTYPRNLEGSITILGERGSVKIGGTAVNKIEHWDPRRRPGRQARRVVEHQSAERTASGTRGTTRNVPAVLRGEARPETDGRAGRKSLELILGIYELTA